MQDTYLWRADGYHGYSWHNYYTWGRETYRTCDTGGFHVSAHFPSFMAREIIINDRPAFVTETDMCSPSQCHGRNLIKDKAFSTINTMQSLGNFFAAEHDTGGADAIVLWLLDNDEAGRTEYDWHEAYNENAFTHYQWFNQWWTQHDPQ